MDFQSKYLKYKYKYLQLKNPFQIVITVPHATCPKSIIHNIDESMVIGNIVSTTTSTRHSTHPCDIVAESSAIELANTFIKQYQQYPTIFTGNISRLDCDL